MTRLFLERLIQSASEPYRAAGHFAYHYARGKLRHDGIFAALLREGHLPAQGRFLDLGCGQGVLASWLMAARAAFDRGDWPPDWPAPPQVTELLGFEMMTKDVARGRAALDERFPEIAIRQGDIRSTDFGSADLIAILDVLHYMDYPAQEDVLRRVRAALPVGGRLITRVGDASAGLPFHICDAVDRAATFVRGHRLPHLHCRPLHGWTALLESLGFRVHTAPMNTGKPFANVMISACAVA
ncbi:MAG: class I SAM-dependent methyltransferase [Rhodocyclaceae bacterium]